MPKAKSSSIESAVVVLTSAKIAAAKVAVLQKNICDQIEIIAREERLVPLRAIFTGIALHVVKNSLKHGEFNAWKKANITSGNIWTAATALKNSSFYMRLAVVALEACGEDAAKAVAGNDLTLALADPQKADRTLVAALTKFIGDSSLNELLREHGIKDAPKLGGRRDPGEAGEETAPPDAEQLYFQYRDEIGSALTTAEQLLLKDNALQHLAGHPEEIRGVVEGLRSLADKVEAAAKPLIAQ
jgi:hypothetical protein